MIFFIENKDGETIWAGEDFIKALEKMKELGGHRLVEKRGAF
jgi:hypothetical protein